MDDECRTRWEHLVKIHFATKRITLRAEESLALDHRTYIQPIREERDAFEHVCRGIASYLELTSHAGDECYLAECFDGARKHAVRAFFDAADWYGQVLREDIKEKLTPYSHECIRTALPDYYPISRMRIDQIAEGIVACREQKDASDEAGTYQEVVTYSKLLEELETIHQRVRDAVPAMEELHTEERTRQLADAQKELTQRRAERPWSLIISISAGLIVAAICAIGGYLFGLSRGEESRQLEHPRVMRTLERSQS